MPTPKYLFAVLTVVLTIGLSGCSTDNKPDAISMSEADVEQILNANLDAVDGRVPVNASDRPTLTQYGCKSSFPSALPEGPPWRYRVMRWYDDPTDTQIDQWRTAALGLSAKGFTEQPAPTTRPNDDPRDIVMRDNRGFQVSLTVTTPPADAELRVDLRASSPCVQPPTPASSR